MKPFDLQAALNGSPVITRDGKQVRIEAYDANRGSEDALIGSINDVVHFWDRNGFMQGNRLMDLFMDTKPHWLIIQHCMDQFMIISHYEDKAEAEKMYGGLINSGISTFFLVSVDV